MYICIHCNQGILFLFDSETVYKLDQISLFPIQTRIRYKYQFICNDNNNDHYLLSFAISQILASCIVTLLWIIMFIRIVIKQQNDKSKHAISGFMTFSDLLPSFSEHIDSELIWSSFMFFFQSIIKFGLTEGEKVVMIALEINARTQGIYSLVSNLGSLIARYVFAQIEKTANTEFSKLNVATNKTVITDILSNVLKMVSILAILCIVFSPNYSFMALDILYGEKWRGTEAPNALALYCWYLLLLSINGITEAFVQSETPDKFYQIFLVIVTVIYWFSVAHLMEMGVSGLIYANCINMMVRIAYNSWFIHLCHIPLSKTFTIIRSWQLFIALIISYFITNKSNQLFITNNEEYELFCNGKKLICYALHSGSAILCLLGIFGVLWKFERTFLLNTRHLMLGKRD